MVFTAFSVSISFYLVMTSFSKDFPQMTPRSPFAFSKTFWSTSSSSACWARCYSRPSVAPAQEESPHRWSTGSSEISFVQSFVSARACCPTSGSIRLDFNIHSTASYIDFVVCTFQRIFTTLATVHPSIVSGFCGTPSSCGRSKSQNKLHMQRSATVSGGACWFRCPPSCLSASHWRQGAGAFLGIQSPALLECWQFSERYRHLTRRT